VHGGGWAIGDKKNSLENKISLFQNERYVFVSTNYRLSPFPYQVENTNKVQYPDHVVDLADALTWIYNNIYKYGGDTTKLAIIGHSAGAHLAALLATDQKWLFANHLNPLILRGVAPLDTEGFNLVSRINRDSAELFLNAFTLDEVAWHEASPLFQIENNEILPPNWLVVERGTNERKEILNEFITKLQTTNAKVTKVIANQYSHEDVNQKIGETGENILTPALKKFLLDCFQ
jgi:acetyl esterase/lipase